METGKRKKVKTVRITRKTLGRLWIGQVEYKVSSILRRAGKKGLTVKIEKELVDPSYIVSSVITPLCEKFEKKHPGRIKYM